MNRIRITESFIKLKEWIKVKFISKSILLQPLLKMSNRAKPDLSSNQHLTPLKIFKWFLGLAPVCYLSYNTALSVSKTTKVDDIISYFKSEDEIFSLLSKSRPVVTFMYLPGDVYSEVTHPGFHEIAEEYKDQISFIKVNCSKNSSFCRSRKLRQFPTIEIYIPPPAEDASFETKTRYRLLKGPGDYAISPFKSDLSYEGFKAALQELKLIPSPDPFSSTKDFFQSQLKSYYNGLVNN